MTEVPHDTVTASTPAAPPLGMEEQQHLRKAQASTNRLLWSILAVLTVLVGVVMFMLPKYVRESRATAAAHKTEVAAPAAAAPTAAAATPYEEAQRLKLREAAQATLSGLLDVQGELEKKDVKRWADNEFAAAVATARKGDEAYAAQRFDDAKALYETATQALQALRASEAERFAAQMKAGDSAFQAGNAEAAVEAYSLAALINPDSSDAATGAARARVLKDVLALLREGSALEGSGSLEAAKEKYQQALALDRANADAGKGVARINTAIVERNFAAAMSRGFAALQSGAPDKAQEAFKQADAIKPGTRDVQVAMQQAQDRQTFSALSVHLDAAKQHEAGERWSEALAAWNAALGVDPNLVSAQEGKQRANGRTNLDNYLVALIKEPLRLADQGVYAQTTQVLGDAAKIANPGPRLQDQLATVRKFVAQVRVPATVTLQSDGNTSVTLYKVSEYGKFTGSKTVSLTPGNYVAVGSRQGFRDVRREFTVAIDGQARVVSVICTDAI